MGRGAATRRPLRRVVMSIASPVPADQLALLDGAGLASGVLVTVPAEAAREAGLALEAGAEAARRSKPPLMAAASSEPSARWVPWATMTLPTLRSDREPAAAGQSVGGAGVDVDGRLRATRLGDRDGVAVDGGDLAGDRRQDDHDAGHGVGPVGRALLAKGDLVADREVAERDRGATLGDGRRVGHGDGAGPAVIGLERDVTSRRWR